MTDFIDRLKSEKGELADKLQRLEHFIERGMPGVSDPHRILLQTQHKAMSIYHTVLGLRLQDLESRAAVASECSHDLIYAPFDLSRNGPTETGKCTRCEQMVSTRGYAQSAARAQGFLTKIQIGEPQEIINADDDRDGPIKFEG